MVPDCGISENHFSPAQRKVIYFAEISYFSPKKNMRKGISYFLSNMSLDCGDQELLTTSYPVNGNSVHGKSWG